MGWLAKLSSLSSLTFGSSSQASENTLSFSANPTITSIGASAFAGTKFSTVDLTQLTNLQTVGTDAFSQMPELKTVTLSESQAKVINPGVFSIADSAGGDSDTTSLSISVMQDSNGQQTPATTFTSSPTTWPTTTVTVANNLNRLDKVTEINLAATNISTLQGGVLFGNSTLQKLVLPATASSWKLTEPTNYQTAPVGWKDGQSNGTNGKGIFFERFDLNTSSTTAKKNAKSNDAFNRLTPETWSQVANILNMFGRVESSQGDSNKDKNLLPWKEGFTDGELRGEMLQTGSIWSTETSGDKYNQPLGQGDQTPLYLTHNNLVWKYTNSNNSTITLTASTANLYRAGYTNNPYAYFQVGFGEDFKAEVQVTLTLVSKN